MNFRAIFGEMSTLFQSRSVVYNIQEDLLNSNHLLFSDAFGIQMFNGSAVSSLVGNSTTGYAEGVGEDARFRHIHSFVQWNTSTIFVPDYNNDCIRRLERNSWRTSQFLGTCGTGGFRDGESPLFNGPWGLIKDMSSKGKIMLTDFHNDAIRVIDIQRKLTTTILKEKVKHPQGIEFFFNLKFLLISSGHALSIYDLIANSTARIAGSDSRGYNDGKLSDAKFDDPGSILIASETIVLVADWNNFVVRVVNVALKTVSSICTPESFGRVDGSVATCELNSPRGLFYRNGLLYIGEQGANRTVPSEL